MDLFHYVAPLARDVLSAAPRADRGSGPCRHVTNQEGSAEAEACTSVTDRRKRRHSTPRALCHRRAPSTRVDPCWLCKTSIWKAMNCAVEGRPIFSILLPESPRSLVRNG